MKQISIATEKIAFILLCLLLIDCSFMGFAAWADFGILSSRMMLLVLCLLFAIPTLILNWKNLLENKYMISILVFAVIVGIAAVVGVLNGNRMGLIIRDIKGFACFMILPAILVILNSKERILCIMKCLMLGSTALAVHSTITLIIFLNNNPLFYELAVKYSKITFAYCGVVNPTIPRLFYQSVMYLLCGCAFAIYFFLRSRKKTRWIYTLIIGICLFAMILTYTRSVYLGAFIAAVLVLVFLWIVSKKEERKKLYMCVVGAVVSLGIILGSFGVTTKTDYLRFAILRTLSGTGIQLDGSDEVISEGEEAYLEQTVVSDNVRAETLKGLYRNIKKAPITGIGLGAEFKERPEGVNEYVYLDIVSKMGIIGLLAYMAPLLIMLRQLFKHRKRITWENAFPVISFFILLGFMVTSHYNPYMNGALGIVFYCFAMANVSWLNTELKKD